MRILHVSTPNNWRGGEQQLLYLWRGLNSLGVEQLILVPKDSVSAKRFNEAGAAVFKVAKAGPWDLRFSAAVAIQSKRFQPDFIHTHDSQAHTFVFLAQKLMGVRVPLVVHRRVDFAVGDNLFSRFKYNDRQCAGVVCVSQLVQKMMRVTLDKPSKCQLIYDGIDAKRFDGVAKLDLRKAYGLSRDSVLIGNVAAITQQKDYFTFVDTVLLLRSDMPRLHFLIIGDGPQRNEIERYAEAKGVLSAITFTGFRADIESVLPALDVLLFTSETEGLGTTILDAFLVGLPVVTTNAGGIPEIAKHRINAWVTDVKDSEGLAKGVREFIYNPELPATFAAAGKETVKAFSYEKTASETLAYYHKLKNS
jgi:L-malate glycosyltransferase